MEVQNVWIRIGNFQKYCKKLCLLIGLIDVCFKLRILTIRQNNSNEKDLNNLHNFKDNRSIRTSKTSEMRVEESQYLFRS